jgi:His/Glu/Gln/Arg/opine family amino acid ABC transporter permease subunit
MDFAPVFRNLPYMLEGLQLTLILAGVSMAGSLLAGTLLAMMRLAPFWWLRFPAAVYVDTVRMIPLIMVIFWIFFLLPILTGHPVSPISAALVALTAFNSSYMAEVVRAGLLSVPRGLAEAARATGLSWLGTLWFIVFPIAFRNVLPAIVTRFIALFMGTSLAYVIGVTEFFRAANNINNRIFKSFEVYLFVAVVYFACCYALSLLSRRLERWLAQSEAPAKKEAASKKLSSLILTRFDSLRRGAASSG